MTDDIEDDDLWKQYAVVETKRHKPCLIFHGYRYVQDKIQNQTIYWRCEDRARCNGRAHQLMSNGSMPILTIKHNHRSMIDDTNAIRGYRRQRQRQSLKTSHRQLKENDDLLLSPTSSTMTSPVKLENHPNRQQYLQQQHDAMVKNLHLSEVITTAAATSAHHYSGIGASRPTLVDPMEMTKLLSNITTSNHSSSKPIPISSNMDYSSRLNHFSWEEIEGRYLPVIFRNENDSLQRYTSKMYVENTLFQSETWQRHAVLARSLPPLISFPYTDNELKLFRSIVEWHLASFHFKTILPSDCLIRFDELLDFYNSLRKLRDTVSTTTFNRPLPPPPMPLLPPPPPAAAAASMPIVPSKQRTIPTGQSFELPVMGGNASMKPHSHHRHSTSTSKVYPPTVHPSHSSSNYHLPQNADLLNSFSNPSSQSFNYNSISSKSNTPVLPVSTQWNENLSKTNEKIRPPPPRMMIPMSNPSISQEQTIRDKHALLQKHSHSSNSSIRETKESGWVQINNVFVPYIVKIKLRENELEKCPTRQSAPQLQREFYVPYEILIKCHIFSDNEFAFKKFLVKATQQDFDIFNSLIANINIFDEKVPEKTLLVNLYHVMIGLQRILYVKFLTTKQPRTQVNKYHAEVLAHKGGTLLMHGNKFVPYIVQNNRFYVPLVYAYHSLPHVLSQAKRGARAPRQYEIDFLNLLFIYFSIDSPPLTSDTLLVDAFSIKSSDLQPPIHFRTLTDHQQFERTKLLNTIPRISQTNNKLSNKSQPQQQQQQTSKSSSLSNSSTHKFNKCLPTNVVVNPLIHHPSFYGLHSSHSPLKQTPSQSSSTSISSSSNSIVANQSLSSSISTKSKSSMKESLIKKIKYGNHLFNALIKSVDQSIDNSKISIKQIFTAYSFDIDYEKFIQWCQTNYLLQLMKLDDEEKQIYHIDQNQIEDYYVQYRYLNRCIELLHDLQRGTISMTLLPSTNNDVGQIKSQLAGAKKRKTTIPTTRHISSSISSTPSSPLPTRTIEDTVSTSKDQRSSTPQVFIDSTEEQLINENSTNENDDIMPIVDTVEEEQPIQSETNSSFRIAELNEGDDAKIHLDDTLPSCSSGYESAAALTNVDINTVHHSSSDNDDDDETNSTTCSREYSSSCQSEQSIAPILSTVSSNIKINSIEQDKIDLSPVISHQKLRQRNGQNKYRVRSRSPTPRHAKKICSTDEKNSSSNTITSDQIEQHLRTLLMPNTDQRRTRTRPIKTPTRLVEEIATNNNYLKSTEPDTNHLDRLSTSVSTTTTNITDTNSNESNLYFHPSCTYNVTISNKPNKLGFTIKKVVQR